MIWKSIFQNVHILWNKSYKKIYYLIISLNNNKSNKNNINHKWIDININSKWTNIMIKNKGININMIMIMNNNKI